MPEAMVYRRTMSKPISGSTWRQRTEKKGAKFRDVLAKQMTPAKIDEAKRLAREWKSTMP
jgi:hypothetical protein